MIEVLSNAVRQRETALVELMRDMVRFPTVNPPGDAYKPCAEFIARHLTKRGFDCQLLTAVGEPGHTDAYPRTNVVARREGKRPARRSTSTRTLMWWKPDMAGQSLRLRALSTMAAYMVAEHAT